jgi:hypothetical protein
VAPRRPRRAAPNHGRRERMNSASCAGVHRLRGASIAEANLVCGLNAAYKLAYKRMLQTPKMRDAAAATAAEGEGR